MNRTCLRLLLLEDDPATSEKLQDSLAGFSDRIQVVSVTNARDAISVLEQKLFHLVSLDQRIPLEDSAVLYTTDDRHLGPVIETFKHRQPISVGVVLTAFASIAYAHETGKLGLQYLQKEPDAIGKWLKQLKELHRKYIPDVLFNRGAERLPNALARAIANLRDQEHPRMKLLAGRDLLEVALQLLTCVCGSVAISDSATHREGIDAIQELFTLTPGRNVDWSAALRRVFECCTRVKDQVSLAAITEFRRFMEGGSMNVWIALDELHRLRNELAHDRLQKEQTYRAIYEEHLPNIQGIIEACFLLAVHPIIGNLQLRHVASGPPLYRVEDYRGDLLNPRPLDVRCDVDNATGDVAWALMCSPGTAEWFFPLAPLVKTVVHHESQQTGLYILESVKKCEYRELSTGRRHAVTTEKEKQQIRDFFRA